MQITTQTTHTITVDSAERDLLRCALGQLAESHRRGIAVAEEQAAAGVNVENYLTGLRTELAALERMSRSLFLGE
jgi:hypothetical protein